MRDLEQSVDVSRPLLDQVGALGEDYDAWVHRSIKPGSSLRLFESDLLEAFSHIPWWLVPLVWVPVTIATAVLAVTWQGVGVGLLVALTALGILLWSLTEYLLHRFVFHFKPRSRFGRKLHFLAHGVHHKDPWDPQRLVFPPLPAALIAVPIFLSVYAGVGWTSNPLGHAMSIMVGLFVGYQVYDMTHFYAHHAKPRSRWGKYLKRYHLAHHHKQPHRLYGVSSPLWDVVFRSGEPH